MNHKEFLNYVIVSRAVREIRTATRAREGVERGVPVGRERRPEDNADLILTMQIAPTMPPVSADDIVVSQLFTVHRSLQYARPIFS